MNKLLLDELMNLAAMAASGKTIDMAALERLKALAAPPPTRKGPDRPKGARTWRDTPAVKRARECLRLQVIDGLKPSQAVKQVAVSGNVDEGQIYNELARHRERLNDEINQGSADAFEAMMKHLDTALPALGERMLKAIAGEHDEVRIRRLLLDAFNHWCIELCEPSAWPIENLSDVGVRNEFCKALLAPIAD
jgi:hypothetical protein